jgi:two-component system LytT family sensor kinase
LQSSFSDKTFKLAFLCWWIAWAVLQYAVLVSFDVSKIESVVDSGISNLLLAGSCLLVSNNMKYYLPTKEKYWYVLALSFGLSIVWIILIRIILSLIFKNDLVYNAMLVHSSTVRFVIAFLMIAFIAVISLLWYTQQEQKSSQERKADAERLSKEAELFKLRQQLQPHFLFNSLNSISALTISRPEEARDMIQQLSDFFRGALKKDDHQWTTLAEEIEYLKLYLDIEKVRFGHRLQTNIDYAEGSLQMKLPSLLLQPLVENAIKFGLYDTTEDVMISIHSKITGNDLQINIGNPFDPETSQALSGTGFGLPSIQRRLFLLFGRKDLLQTKTIEKNFITTVIIPQTKA